MARYLTAVLVSWLDPTGKLASMILGVGTDVVAIGRIAAMLDRHGERAIRRLYSREEVEYCLDRSSRTASFAVRFAAKEAFYKALGTGVGAAGGWRDVEVVRTGGGAPRVRLQSAAAAAAEVRGVRHVHLSLSHTDDVAIAFVVLEG